MAEKFLSGKFIISAEKLSQCPTFNLPEFPLLGRSNVGKSSFINGIANHRKLAKTSNTPGKTRLINFFDFSGKFMIADLPGYGYAKVSASEKMRWSGLMESFFADEKIDAAVLIVDARHLPTKDDKMMAEWMQSAGCRFAVVANKTDKIKKSMLENCISDIKGFLELDDDIPLIPFSAEKGDGREALISFVESCM